MSAISEAFLEAGDSGVPLREARGVERRVKGVSAHFLVEAMLGVESWGRYSRCLWMFIMDFFEEKKKVGCLCFVDINVAQLICGVMFRGLYT